MCWNECDRFIDVPSRLEASRLRSLILKASNDTPIIWATHHSLSFGSIVILFHIWPLGHHRGSLLRIMSPLYQLPGFNDEHLHSQTAEDDAPLHADSLVLEHSPIQLRNIDEWEDNDKAADTSPEEELVVI